MRRLEMSYPMYVISVIDLLTLDRMQPHQDLLKKGMAREWIPAMRGRTIFASHEWLGWDDPDPNGEQITALKLTFQHLMHGRFSKVEAELQQQLKRKQNTVVTAARFKAALPHMFVWVDFMGIPQKTDS